MTEIEETTTKAELYEQKKNALELLVYMQQSSWHKCDGLVGFAFDMANLACALARLNRKLKANNIEVVKMPEAFYQEAVEMFKKDPTYDVSFADFKELVPMIPMEIILPNWF